MIHWILRQTEHPTFSWLTLIKACLWHLRACYYLPLGLWNFLWGAPYRPGVNVPCGKEVLLFLRFLPETWVIVLSSAATQLTKRTSPPEATTTPITTEEREIFCSSPGTFLSYEDEINIYEFTQTHFGDLQRFSKTFLQDQPFSLWKSVCGPATFWRYLKKKSTGKKIEWLSKTKLFALNQQNLCGIQRVLFCVFLYVWKVASAFWCSVFSSRCKFHVRNQICRRENEHVAAAWSVSLRSL